MRLFQAIFFVLTLPTVSAAQTLVCDTLAECAVGDSQCEPGVIETIQLVFNKKGSRLEMITPEGTSVPLDRVHHNGNVQSFIISNESVVGYLTLIGHESIIFSGHRLFFSETDPYALSAYGTCYAAPSS